MKKPESVRFETLKQAKDFLTDSGFREHEWSFRTYEIANFQKRYGNETGIRNFVNAKIYDYRMDFNVSYNFAIGYSAQIYQKGTHDAVNMEFIGWELDAVEKWIEQLFEQGIIEYYEIY